MESNFNNTANFRKIISLVKQKNNTKLTSSRQVNTLKRCVIVVDFEEFDIDEQQVNYLKSTCSMKESQMMDYLHLLGQALLPTEHIVHMMP